MTTRSAKSDASAEIAAIEELMSDLEKRLRRLSGNARREVAGASGEVGDFVSDALARITNRVRETASEAGQSVSDGARRFGNDAVKKLASEAEQHPLFMLAAAAAVGFIVGLARR